MGVTEVNEENLMHQGDGIHRGNQSREDKLEALGKAFGQLLSNGNLTGQTANNINAYIREVHQNGVLKALQTLVQAYDDATAQYVAGYMQVDSNPTAHLLKDELNAHKSQLNSFKNQFTQSQNRIAQIVNSVSYIYVPGSYQDFLGKMRTTEDRVNEMQNIVRDLISNWDAYEGTNYYQNVAELLPQVQAALSQFSGKNLAAVSGYVSGSFASLNAEMLNYVDQMGQIHSQYSKDFSSAWDGVQKTEKVIDDEEKKRKAEAAKNFWMTLGLTALAVVITVATGGLGSPLAVSLFAVDMAFSANSLIASGTEAITGHEFNPMVEGLKLTGMDDKTAAMVVNVASMSTIVVGGIAGGAKMLGKVADLYEAGELGSTVMDGLRQIPKLPATAVKSVLNTASDIKTIAVNKVGSVLDRISDKAGSIASKLDDMSVVTVRVADTGMGTVPVLTRVAASDTKVGGAVKQAFSSISSKSDDLSHVALQDIAKTTLGKADNLSLDTKKVLQGIVDNPNSTKEQLKAVDELTKQLNNAPKNPLSKEAQDYISSIKPDAENGISRPNPEEYLPKDYIENHLQDFKQNGAARFQKFEPSKDWNNGIVGGEDGSSFWLSKNQADLIQQAAGGDNRNFEKLLGFNEGYLGNDSLNRLDVSPDIVAEHNISLPSGNESGANEFWKPGGNTYPGGMPEAVMKDIGKNEGDYTWQVLK